jgi:enolase
MSKIQSVTGYEIIDSRGNPTVEVECILSSGATARASVPSGASTGAHEAFELRDNDPKRFNGLGTLTAVQNINTEISQAISGKEFDQQTLDKTLIALDGTENKSRLGANALLGVSLAFARAVAKEKGVELYNHLGSIAGTVDFKLPLPFFNIINGGKHADSGLDIQEFMIAPVGLTTFHEKVRAGAEVITALKKILKEKGYSVGVGDEGGFAPKLKSNEEAFELIMQAIQTSGYSHEEIKIGIDAAASSFYHEGTYQLKIGGEEKKLTNVEMVNWYTQLANTYPIYSIEDGLAEDDWEGFTLLTETLGKTIHIVGDDLTVTNNVRIQTAIEKKAINAVLIKLNQIGTLTETINAIELTKKQNWIPFISHRSGETTDTFIADLAVGLSCDCIKSGSLVRGERVAKYNRLLQIENLIR